MGTIRKIGEDYFIEFYARGLLYQQKAGRDQAVAERVLREVESKIAKGELLTVVRQIHWDSFFEEFNKESAGNFPPATCQRFQRLVAHFSAFLKEHWPNVEYISHVTPAVTEDYRAFLIKLQRQNSAFKKNKKIINLSILLLREICEYGIKKGYINDNPTLHSQLLKIDSAQEIIIKPPMIEQIMQKGGLELNIIIPFILETGLRLQELIQLTWSQVDWSKPSLKITDLKSLNKWREVPLSLNAVAILKDQAEKSPAKSSPVFLDACLMPLEIQKLTALLQSTVLALGGLAPLGFYSFRKLFAVKSLSNGLSLFRLAEILGVNDIAKMMVFSPWIPMNREDMYKVNSM